jgi:predicted dehydrogenase
MIHEGIVGDPIDGRAAWNNGWGPIGLPSEGGRVWLGRRQRSGDWMLEQACHTWDVLNWISGALPEAASGEGRQDIFTDIDPDRNVTDFYFALLRFPKKFLVDFQHSWFTPHKEGGRWSGVFERVAGKKGGIALDEGKIFPRDDKGEVQDVPGEGKDTTPQSVNAFFECVRTGQKPPSGVENGRAATLTGLLVRKAVYERRWVNMNEITGTSAV